MNEQQLLNILFGICGLHRERYNILTEPHTKDCQHLPCKTGCPIKRLPDAVSEQELMQIGVDVAREERLHKLEGE